MRIEPVEHAVDRLLDQLGIVRLLDVVGSHALEHVTEQIELPVGVGCRRFGASAEEGHAARLGGRERDRHAGGRTEEDQRSLAYHPRTFSLSDAHHGLGSTGLPSFRNSIYRIGWLEPVATAAADCGPPPMIATGSPVNTNWPRSTEIRSIPASST